VFEAPNDVCSIYLIRINITEITSIKRFIPMIGFSFISLETTDGITRSPFFFQQGGIKEFISVFGQYASLSKSDKDSNVFLVNDTSSSRLKKTISELKITTDFMSPSPMAPTTPVVTVPNAEKSDSLPKETEAKEEKSKEGDKSKVGSNSSIFNKVTQMARGLSSTLFDPNAKNSKAAVEERKKLQAEYDNTRKRKSLEIPPISLFSSLTKQHNENSKSDVINGNTLKQNEASKSDLMNNKPNEESKSDPIYNKPGSNEEAKSDSVSSSANNSGDNITPTQGPELNEKSTLDVDAETTDNDSNNANVATSMPIAINSDHKTTNTIPNSLSNSQLSTSMPNLGSNSAPVLVSFSSGTSFSLNASNQTTGAPALSGSFVLSTSPPKSEIFAISDNLPVLIKRHSMTTEKWKSFFDSEGKISNPGKLKKEIFFGCVSPELRVIVWKFLLGYFPFDSTEAEREEIVKEKRESYQIYKRQWSTITLEQEKYFSKFRERRHRIQKDTVRTDRNLDYFNQEENLQKITDILLTYSFYNFDLGYVQGMNDLLAPILQIMDDEADAFWCFVGFMEVMRHNFDKDQHGMHQLLTNLRKILQVLDPAYYEYFEKNDCLNFFFCYRWLLISFKREFPFAKLTVLWEVLWCNPLTSNFQIFVCIAILEGIKSQIISGMKFDEILRFINDLSMKLNLDYCLKEAEILYYKFTRAATTTELLQLIS